MTIREAYEGGTAMGAIQVYPARQLDALHGLPDRVDGVSVGSITAWARAADDLDTLERVWRGIKGARSFQRLRWWWPVDGLYDFTPLARTLREHIADKVLMRPCYVHMVDLANKDYERVLLNDLPAADRIDAVLASCSQYGIHVATLVNGRPKCDGGARHTLPWVPDRYDKVWAVCCSPMSEPWADNPIDPDDVTIARGLEIILDSLQARDRALLMHQARTAEVWLVEPPERYGSPFAADPATIAHRLDVVGPAAWERRRLVEPLQPGDIPRLLAGY